MGKIAGARTGIAMRTSEIAKCGRPRDIATDRDLDRQVDSNMHRALQEQDGIATVVAMTREEVRTAEMAIGNAAHLVDMAEARALVGLHRAVRQPRNGSTTIGQFHRATSKVRAKSSPRLKGIG